MLNIGLVGLGFIGNTHLNVYDGIDHCKVKAIYTRSGNKNENVTNDFNGYITSEYDDLLADQDIDVIDICLPTFLHEEYILKAANAGKHIICEKPLTLSVESARRIIDVVNENNVQLYVGHILRFWPEYKLIKSFSKEGELKDIEIVHARRLGQVPSWNEWFQDPQKSGGALYDLHIHDIDFTHYLLGEVKTVYSAGIKNSKGAWDHIMTTLTFKNNCKAFIEASHRMPKEFPFTMSYRVQAKNSTLDFNIKAGENIEDIDNSQNNFVIYSDGKNTPVNAEENNAFYNELSYFIDCIIKNKQNTIIPLSDVLYTLQVIDAIEQSLHSERIVKL